MSWTGDKHIMVVGAGLMGSGIAQVAAQAGFSVTLVDSMAGALENARARILRSVSRLTQAGKLSEPEQAALSRIAFTTDLSKDAPHADLVIEAIIEQLAPKQDLFARLDRLCRPEITLATNTSQFQISKIAELCEKRDRVVGMHWSNPPPMMPLVEIIAGRDTSGATLESTRAFVKACGKASVTCAKDVPGFISNRLSTVLFMEAIRLVEEEIATPEDIDAVARLMFGHRMGPIATLDLAGLDTALHVSTALDAHYGGTRFTPPQLLKTMVNDGKFGRKSGAGFHLYEDGKT